MEAFRGVALIGATITTGLIAGLFYAFSCAVMPGLRRTDDRTFVGAMQWINVRILNGWFALGFAGSLLLTVLAGALHLVGDAPDAPLPWIAGAAALYVLALVITFGVSIPLNDALDAAGDPGAASASALADVRERFEEQWVRWNIVRAVVSTGALGCLVWALVLYGRATP
ncbi:DUF1772 domain-containing protein [Streptomyces sp. H10-C2]|uniref:anthrone oxygenase family protein n=1 Tax=unclassified Streptomyces TaxID=2593676 RepID=UPI0024BB8128|nr:MULTISPECIES: DUF1772 domain-containing protein [unclassified Streptomyces]MDJ0346231.1 DUF1772 domain-containing protein [Streptomyces sp. PH10-H1]MDJ0371746.1 DUF1772 domain-containing protein [Streptomyces sp. H10-C2]